MPNQTSRLDRVFHALSDPTRRAVVERLGRGPAPMSQLALPFKMALPSFSQHLAVLEQCGIVQSRKSGRVRTYSLNPEALSPANGWLENQRAEWSARLDRLDAFLLQNQPKT